MRRRPRIKPENVERAEEIIREYYGLNGNPKTLDKVRGLPSSEPPISRERARQLKHIGILNMAEESQTIDGQKHWGRVQKALKLPKTTI